MNRGGFSWKRFLGISRMKYQISRKTGIPLTKSGRDQKVGRILTKGCLSSLKMVVLIAFLALVINAFLIQ